MITMYGIPNCDNIKKARRWLDEHDLPYQFHNYKKDGICEEQLTPWVNQLGWTVLLNKRGTTWRKLTEEQKSDMHAAKAIALMCKHSSMIKRPLLLVEQHLGTGTHIEVGYSEQRYAELFA